MLNFMRTIPIAFALAVSAFAASPALAEGPAWLVAGKNLLSGETLTTTGKSTGTITFKAGSIITISCEKASDTGKLSGGLPGKGTAELELTGCSVEGKTESQCHVNSPGSSVGKIAVKADTELVYLGTKEEAEAEGARPAELLKPSSGETLVEVDIAGSSCPLFTKGEQEIKGSLITEILPDSVESKVESILFPLVFAEESVYRWDKAGEITHIEPHLTVFGTISVTATGGAEIEVEGGKEFAAVTGAGVIEFPAGTPDTIAIKIGEPKEYVLKFTGPEAGSGTLRVLVDNSEFGTGTPMGQNCAGAQLIPSTNCAIKLECTVANRMGRVIVTGNNRPTPADRRLTCAS
jgi:hypothetical protein